MKRIAQWFGSQINSFTKQDEINHLQDQSHSLLNKFEEDAAPIVESINKRVGELNSYIHLINGVRHDDIGPLIKQLYVFLERIGQLDTQLSPYDLQLESTSMDVRLTDKISDEYFNMTKKLDKQNNKWLDGSPIKVFFDRKTNRSKLLEGEKDFA
jgi:hypothetical protein